ncbi:uncharacterized protein [Epargyreus clarus]|uniref:uncharacterized protein n=1 Tax=Epargyreus clarus TaxID=520877 RepID=UPI003C302ABB
METKTASEQKERLNKLREERIAREKARIEKLRELNLKKYNKNEPSSLLKQSVSNISVASRSKSDTSQIPRKSNVSNPVKNNFHVNGTTKRPITAPNVFKKPTTNKDVKAVNKDIAIKKDNKTSNQNEVKSRTTNEKDSIKNNKPSSIAMPKPKLVAKTADVSKKVDFTPNKSTQSKPKLDARKSIATNSRASYLPKPNATVKPTEAKPQSQSQSRQSVFDSLYKPKMVPKESVNNATKLKTDPNYLKQVIRDSNLILNKRHTVFETKKTVSQPVRRSISAVHFKRISKNELSNCIHKWASIGEKLNKVNIKDVNEDDCIKNDIIVSAVKSERKRVKFQTPVPFNFNTPKPEELQRRLHNWLQKRGKSLDSFHHLQCFGIHHLAKEIKPLNEPPKFELYDDDNKENVPLDSDSDDDSYTENMNEAKDGNDKVDFNKDKWRKASYVSDSATDYNESTDTITSNEVMHHVDELLLGALNDLTELLREGFDWEQCARWLRAIRERSPAAPDSAAYWECRAALEERRGDLPASVQCWEEAIAKGTEHSVVEANLDQLLDKFLQLKISPSSGRRRPADPKMVDVKNVFKSTIIRFAVQQAKLRQSNQTDQQPKFTVTPVRRSARLSIHCTKQTPLRICTSVKQAYELGPAEFRPNRTLTGSP